MDHLKIISSILLLSSLKIAQSQDEFNLTQIDYKVSIYEVNYGINNEKIPHILTDLVMKNSYINSMEFQKVLTDLNVNSLPIFYQELWIQPGIEALFKESPTNLPKFIRKVIEKFENKRGTLKNILELLNIDAEGFLEALTFDEDEKLYKYLKTGDYNPTALEQVYKVANTTLAELVGLAQTEVITPITQKTFGECLNIFGETKVKNFLNESLYNVQVENVKQDSLIYSILTNLTSMLNGQPIWTVETRNGFISIPKTERMYDETKDYVQAVLKNVLDDTDTKIVHNVYIDHGKSYSTIQIDNNTLLSSDVTITNNYNTIPDNCTYLKKSGGELENVNVTVMERKEPFLYVSHFGINSTIGSPLICNKEVYGLLTNQTDEKLQFLLLRSDLDDDIDYPTEGDNDDHNGSLFPQLSIICVLLSFVVNLFVN